MGSFHQIPRRFNGEWVGSLWNRETKGAGRPPWSPLSWHPRDALEELARRRVAAAVDAAGVRAVLLRADALPGPETTV